MKWLRDAGYEHYEVSNFAKPGFRSKHNSSYWKGISYLGLGPSAHSFDGECRWWNVANNALYIQAINTGTIPSEKETLTPKQQVNERIMISLRTIEGLDLRLFSPAEQSQLLQEVKKYLHAGKVVRDKNFLRLTNEGKLLADGIAADLFF